MTSLNQPREKSENLDTPTLSQNGMKGDYARGLRTLPAPNDGPDFARGERTMPPTPEGPDYARGLRGK